MVPSVKMLSNVKPSSALKCSTRKCKRHADSSRTYRQAAPHVNTDKFGLKTSNKTTNLIYKEEDSISDLNLYNLSHKIQKEHAFITLQQRITRRTVVSTQIMLEEINVRPRFLKKCRKMQ